MRVVEYRVRTDAAPEAALTPMDDFAALRSNRAALPAIGGYRILRPGAGRRRARSQTLQRLAGARLRATGFLSALFVGGLGLAVLAGPANCPCNSGLAAAPQTLRDARLVSRFAYVKAAGTDADAELPMLSMAALVEPGDDASASMSPAMGFSPISTAAIAPLDNERARDTYAARARVAGFPAKIEALSEAPPRLVRLAAASPPEDDLTSLQPIVVITTPAAPEVIAVDVEPDPDAAAKHVSKPRSRSASRARRARLSAAKAGTSTQVARAPRWAQQMFDTPWQSSAFSYIR
jgi:hypothetical protein